MFLAWGLMDMNIALLVWVGTGGMMAAFAGPLVMGALWRGVTASGAYAGLITGMTTFLVLHSGILPDGGWGPLDGVLTWLSGESPNPYSCAAMGELVSVGASWAVSKRTQPVSAALLERMFGPDPVS